MLLSEVSYRFTSVLRMQAEVVNPLKVSPLQRYQFIHSINSIRKVSIFFPWCLTSESDSVDNSKLYRVRTLPPFSNVTSAVT